jgi:hypothetical protein
MPPAPADGLSVLDARSNPFPFQALSRVEATLSYSMLVKVKDLPLLDIVSINGHVYAEVDSAQLGSTYREARLLYSNAWDGKYKDIRRQCGPGCTQPHSSHGLATGDLWNDGPRPPL